MKRLLSVILAIVMVFCFTVTGFAKENKTLRFNDDGKFTIVHLTDSHLDYPIQPFLRQYIVEMLDTVKPDLVVLGGDVSTEGFAPNEVSENPLEDSIKDLCTMLVEREIYFTVVFGNHDCQGGRTAEMNFDLYRKYGGEYFLAYDAVPELTGYGTHDLPIMSSDGKKVAFNLYMIDSGDCVFDENGNNIGYDSVHPDQIEWYKQRANQLKSENGGQVVPSMVFQHIIVQEIDDYLFYSVKNSAGALGEEFDGRHYLFTPIPKIHNIKDGFIMEKPCPGYYNYGQLEAMKETGDVIAVFSGHDHSNTFTVNIDGIDVVNTGGCKRQASLRLFTSGVRVITLDENNPTEYESSMYTVMDAAKKDGSQILSQGDVKKSDVIITGMWEKIFTLAMQVFYFINK